MNPLTEEHLRKLNELLKSCAETREYLKRCGACHLDVDKEMRENEEQAKIASAIKAQFWPHDV